MRRRRRQLEPESSFWISYSDLITGTMLIFVLMMFVRAESAREERDASQTLREELSKQTRVLKVVEKEAVELVKLYETLSGKLATAVEQTNNELGGKTIFRFKDGEVFVSEQDVTWFSSGSSRLSSKSSRRQIMVFYKNLYDVLLRVDGQPGIPLFLKSIIIEGHTDPRSSSTGAAPWSFESYNGKTSRRRDAHQDDSNLFLGQQRAKAIVDLIQDEYAREGTETQGRPWQLFTAVVQTSGRGWTRSYCPSEDDSIGRPLTLADFRRNFREPCSHFQQEGGAASNRYSRRVSFSFDLDTTKILGTLQERFRAIKAETKDE